MIHVVVMLSTVHICLQKRFLRGILFKNKNEASKPLFKQSNLSPLKYIFVYKVPKLFYARNGKKKIRTD